MSKSELQAVLGYLNVGLAIAHNTGVSVGHFGNTDFIGLAETVNGLLLHAISPANGDGVAAGAGAAGAMIPAAPASPAAMTAQ
jgi:hypothetical protein